MNVEQENKATIPWENRPEGNIDPVWRYSGNPIITRKHIPGAAGIYNSAIIRFEDGFAGVFRCDDRRKCCSLHRGVSRDGIEWRIDAAPLEFAVSHHNEQMDKVCVGYDPRVCWLEDRYYITWCNIFRGMPVSGLAYTFDFQSFHQMENAFMFNRNGVLFPRRVNGKYAMLNRPSDNNHTPYGNIIYSESPDLVHWGEHKLVLAPEQPWEITKVGAGPTPIETPEGWLLIYHGVITRCNGYVYSAGVALLDLEKPWRVIARGKSLVMGPEMPYECMGEVPNVVFPCTALRQPDSTRLAIYYGAADSVIGLAFADFRELIEHAKKS